MRIVLPYNTHLGGYDTERVVGGIEKFCHQINDTFDDVRFLNIDNNNPIKDNTTKIKNFAKDCNADIIISNWHQASFSGAKILDSEVPIMFINHGNHRLGSILPLMKNIMNKNHSCYMVSKYQHEWYRAMSKRMNADDVIIDGYINSSYVRGDKPELLDIEYDCCTIGRCDSVEKKPFLLKDWLENTNFKTVLMTNMPTDEKGLKYLNKNSHWDGVIFDLKHKDVMKTLSKSMTYFSTCPMEAWGITALEALSHGVPVILNSKNGSHASTDLCSSDSYYKLVSKDIQLAMAIDSFENIDRKEIQDAAWDKHSHDKWKTSFINAIDRTVEKYKKWIRQSSQINTLEGFMND
tara:strand:- start:193 stop:1242 length:1050 start_codon:yes stop_codon:yes gene_type:complete